MRGDATGLKVDLLVVKLARQIRMVLVQHLAVRPLMDARPSACQLPNLLGRDLNFIDVCALLLVVELLCAKRAARANLDLHEKVDHLLARHRVVHRQVAHLG